MILDACCGINLLASGVLADIVRAQGVPVAIADLVLRQEVLRLPAEDEGLAQGETSPDRELTLQPLVDAGHLEVMAADSEEETATFVALARRLDDGEAMSAALAIHRNGDLATDDRKAIRVLGAEAPALKIRRTSDLVRTWSQVARPSAAEVRDVLRRIEDDASFIPPGTDPNADWWRERRER